MDICSHSQCSPNAGTSKNAYDPGHNAQPNPDHQIYPDDLRMKSMPQNSRGNATTRKETVNIQQQQRWRRGQYWNGRRQRRQRMASSSHSCQPFPSLFPLFLCISLLFGLANSTAGTKTAELDVDWTLDSGQNGTTEMAKAAKGVNSSSSSSQQQSSNRRVLTKYVRLKDVLRFRCPSTPSNGLNLAIHLVSAESALLCQLPAEQKERDRTLIGICGPKSGDPRLILRRYSPLPGKPTFQEGNSYYFITTSDGTSEGIDQASGGLCRSHGLRLRVVVLQSNGEGTTVAESRPADEITDLAQLLFPAPAAENAQKPVQNEEKSTALPPIGVDSFGVFPAILTLEEGGQRRKVVVNSQRELAEQIELASTNGYNGGEGGGKRKLPKGEQHLSERQQQDAHYELMDNRGPWHPSPRGLGNARRKVFESTDSDEKRPAAKSVRSPEPLATETQRLVYIIGYDGHESVEGRFTFSSSNGMPKLSILFLLLSICSILAFYLLICLF